MRRSFTVALVLAGCMAVAPRICAQAPAGGDGAKSEKGKPAGEAQKPAGEQPKPWANEFPEDVSNVPVLPSRGTPDLPPGTYNGSDSTGVPLPGEDADPVRSPDDQTPAASGQDQSSSSSLTGLDTLLPGPETEEPGRRKGKQTAIVPTHTESASEDINVGKYYLDNKDWKAARSRFESAMVLDPENPEVYWGLAESERHLGDFASARTHYEKVAEYDPDSKHGKEARKALKEPQIANAKSAAAGQSIVGAPK